MQGEWDIYDDRGRGVGRVGEIIECSWEHGRVTPWKRRRVGEAA